MTDIYGKVTCILQKVADFEGQFALSRGFGAYWGLKSCSAQAAAARDASLIRRLTDTLSRRERVGRTTPAPGLRTLLPREQVVRTLAERAGMPQSEIGATVTTPGARAAWRGKLAATLVDGRSPLEIRRQVVESGQGERVSASARIVHEGHFTYNAGWSKA